MYYIAEIACVVSEIWMIHMLMSAGGKKADRPLWQLLAAYGVFGCVLTALSFAEGAAFLRMGFCLLSIWGMAVLLFRTTVLRGLLLGALFILFAALVDVVASLIMVWAGIDSGVLLALGIPRTIYLIFTHILLLLVVMLVCLFYRKGAREISLRILLPVAPCWLVTTLLCCLLSWQVFISGETVHWAYIAVLLGLLYTNIVMIYYMVRMNRQAQYRQEMELAEHHYAMQQEYYEQFRVQQEETRAIWHDLSKYLLAIRTDETDQSLTQLRQMLDSVVSVVDVNNRVISVILNEYVQAAKAAEVKLVMEIQVPPELFVTAADLYVLIGNTMDNALEACAGLPVEERRILLKLKTHNSILFYDIENPCAPQPEKLRSKFRGYGLKNVRRCVERYNGNLEVIRENGVFRVRAHLNSV